jgi:hypothetical protein
MENNIKSLTRKQLANRCGVPFYTINYLQSLNRLPLIKLGRQGCPHLYHPDSVTIIRDYLKEKQNNEL